MTLASSTYSDGLLTLSFRDVTDIIAGRPYLICWYDGEDLVNPTFRDVTITFSHSSTQTINAALTHLGIQTDYATFTGNIDSPNTANGAFRATLTLADPANGDYSFKGWFTDAELTTPFTTIPPLDNDGQLKLYAAFNATITFAKEGYSTYYNSQADAILPAGMKARIITAKGDGTTLTYQTIADGSTQQNVVPAGTAVMLQIAPSNAPQNIDVTLTTPAAAAIWQNNLLYGSDAPTTTTGSSAGAMYYKLSYNTINQNLAWYWGANNGAPFQSGAHKAWLTLPSSAQNSATRFVPLPTYPDNTTDVLPLPNPVVKQGAWYHLDGTPLDTTPTAPGLYINNGQIYQIR